MSDSNGVLVEAYNLETNLDPPFTVNDWKILLANKYTNKAYKEKIDSYYNSEASYPFAVRGKVSFKKEHPDTFFFTIDRDDEDKGKLEYLFMVQNIRWGFWNSRRVLTCFEERDAFTFTLKVLDIHFEMLSSIRNGEDTFIKFSLDKWMPSDFYYEQGHEDRPFWMFSQFSSKFELLMKDKDFRDEDENFLRVLEPWVRYLGLYASRNFGVEGGDLMTREIIDQLQNCFSRGTFNIL